jgi:hypothetical protein
VRYEIDVEPMWIGHCYCTMCRKHTGAVVGTYVGFPRGTVRWVGREPARYESSKDVERSFCPTCGSTIGFHRPHETSLTVGSLDRPDDILASCESRTHVFHDEKIGWFDIADSWTRFDRFAPGREEELERMSGQPIKD